MGKADLHIHTSYSWDGASSVPAVLEQAANYAGLDVIAITDHDNLDGAREAEKQANRYGIEVITGCEITTAEGHLLALYIDQPVPAGRSLAETVLQVGELGGLCIAAHPTARGVSSLSAQAIRRALKINGVSEILIGIESYNPGLLNPHSNHNARLLCDELGLAHTASSDSHISWTIGMGLTGFPGRTAQDLRRALLERTTTAISQVHRPSPGFYLSHIKWRLLRIMGWVHWIPGPQAEFVLRRLIEVQPAV